MRATLRHFDQGLLSKILVLAPRHPNDIDYFSIVLQKAREQGRTHVPMRPVPSPKVPWSDKSLLVANDRTSVARFALGRHLSYLEW